ncbi:MAG: NAD(P)(+) transhydrogenase (Re/Si-specific) subunit beta [Holosporales bacterium]|jgi:NAD(P) transhydrogenase subunit beta|nr:NAD(P)(+) transhydrogenase (Re/Si-specific) subunit beta [Holosporales bacterium]
MLGIETLTIFILACFVGYYVVSKVTPALHAPLMSVTNAISSVIVVVALTILAEYFFYYKITGNRIFPWFELAAVFLAMTNIVGGFSITKRMLEMFSAKKQNKINPAARLIIIALCVLIYGRYASFCRIPSLIECVLFILALGGLSSAKTASRGNMFGTLGMALALAPSVTTIILDYFRGGCYIPEVFYSTLAAIFLGGGVGFYIAKKVSMTSLPQLVAAFHSLVGLAAVFIACSIFQMREGFLPTANAIEMSLGAAIGAITFTGSVVAFGKLQGFISGKPLKYPGQRRLNFLVMIAIAAMIVYFVINQSALLFASVIAASLIIGYLLIAPIGGADMPVVVSMLNSYSGWAAAGIGFTMGNTLLIVVGALVGTSGAMLSDIMCKGMNRSLIKVIFGGGEGKGNSSSPGDSNHENVKLCSPEDAAFIIKNSASVIIVPGYGMAVSQAQHAIKELADILKANEISVKYAIHPVAGRMPGHMNVLLAESNIPYEDVFEIDEINHEFGSTDVAIVIGANDITNPAAKNDPTSPIYGMPILDVEKAKTVLFVKRSLGSGYAGIDNPLFYQSNTMMILGDAKKVIEGMLKAIK